MTDSEPAAGLGWLVHALDLTVLDITGRDRKRFLHSFCTAEVQQRSSGETCEAMILDSRGKLVGLVQLVFLDDAIRLLSVPGQAETLRTHFERFVIREDVRFEDRSSQFRHDFVFLPVGSVRPDPAPLPPDGKWVAWVPVNGLLIATCFAGPGWLVQTRRKGHPDGQRRAEGRQPSVSSARQARQGGQPEGGLIKSEPEALAGNADSTINSHPGESASASGSQEFAVLSVPPEGDGGEHRPGGSLDTTRGLASGVAPASLNELQLHRIRAGSPWFGVDCDGETLPQELQRDALAISFIKGCYLGQETVARIDALGHVNKWLVVLRSCGSHQKFGPERVVTAADREVGRLTSVEVGPDGRAWGLATIRRREAAVGCQLMCGNVALEVTGRGQPSMELPARSGEKGRPD